MFANPGAKGWRRCGRLWRKKMLFLPFLRSSGQSREEVVSGFRDPAEASQPLVGAGTSSLSQFPENLQQQTPPKFQALAHS